jgi:hypothetical protein
MLAHIAGMPVEEWLMPFIFSAGAAFVGLRARFGASRSSTTQEDARRERTSR